jgi:hypothetical protein
VAAKDRIMRKGQLLDYTCENVAYKTDTRKGKPHGKGFALGSVFGEPLAGTKGEGYSLWLEHVVQKKSLDTGLYWLMWYKNGIPTIPMSGVFRKEDIANMVRLLASLIP